MSGAGFNDPDKLAAARSLAAAFGVSKGGYKNKDPREKSHEARGNQYGGPIDQHPSGFTGQEPDMPGGFARRQPVPREARGPQPALDLMRLKAARDLSRTGEHDRKAVDFLSGNVTKVTSSQNTPVHSQQGVTAFEQGNTARVPTMKENSKPSAEAFSDTPVTPSHATPMSNPQLANSRRLRLLAAKQMNAAAEGGSRSPLGALPNQPLANPSQQPSAIQNQQRPALPNQQPPALQSQQPSAIQSQQNLAIPSQQPSAIQNQRPSAIQNQQRPAIQSQQPSAIQSQQPPAPAGPSPSVTPQPEFRGLAYSRFAKK